MAGRDEAVVGSGEEAPDREAEVSGGGAGRRCEDRHQPAHEGSFEEDIHDHLAGQRHGPDRDAHLVPVDQDSREGGPTVVPPRRRLSP